MKRLSEAMGAHGGYRRAFLLRQLSPLPDLLDRGRKDVVLLRRQIVLHCSPGRSDRVLILTKGILRVAAAQFGHQHHQIRGHRFPFPYVQAGGKRFHQLCKLALVLPGGASPEALDQRVGHPFVQIRRLEKGFKKLRHLSVVRFIHGDEPERRLPELIVFARHSCKVFGIERHKLRIRHRDQLQRLAQDIAALRDRRCVRLKMSSGNGQDLTLLSVLQPSFSAVPIL